MFFNADFKINKIDGKSMDLFNSFQLCQQWITLRTTQGGNMIYGKKKKFMNS